jgi:hypothetical protein
MAGGPFVVKTITIDFTGQILTSKSITAIVPAEKFPPNNPS